MRNSLKITAIVAGGVLVLGTAAAAGAALAEGGQTTVVEPAANPASTPSPAPTKTKIIIRAPAGKPSSPSSGSSDCGPTGCGPGSTPPSGPAGADPYQSNGFFNAAALEKSVANQQVQALAAAPASQYYHAGPGYAAVTVTCSYLRMNTYSCSATDSDGDTGTGDEVQVASDGNSWSDTGMHWAGPDIPGGRTTVTDPVSNWTAS